MKRIVLFFTLVVALFAGKAMAKSDEEIVPLEVDNSIVIDRICNEDILVTISSPIFSFKEAEITLKFVNPQHTKLLLNKNRVEFIINGETRILDFTEGVATFKHKFDSNSKTITIYTEDFSFTKTVTVYPLWAILLPLVLIVLYLLKRLLFKK